MKNIKAFSCNISLMAGGQSNAKHELRLGMPPVCLPCVYLTSLHVTKSPRFPPLYLRIINNQVVYSEKFSLVQ